MVKRNTCVFISGKGSNLKNLISHSRNSNFPIKISLVISNNEKAYGLNYAKKFKIPYILIDTKLKNYENAEIYYSLGLTLDPKNSYINLYIGELYLNTRRVNLAEERLKVLSDCNCIEYNELKESISKF